MTLLTVAGGIGMFSFSLCLSFFMVFLCFNFFFLLTRNISFFKEIKENNIAVSILSGSFIISISIIICISGELIVAFMNNQIPNLPDILLLEKISRAILMLTISLFLAFLIIWFTMKSFALITSGIDDMKEILKNNLSVAVSLATMILTVTVMITNAIENINLAFIPIEKQNAYGIQQTFINMNLFLFGAFELLLMLISGLLLFYVGLKVINLMLKGLNKFSDLKEDNLALSVLFCSLTISLFVVVSYNVMERVDVFSLLLHQSQNSGEIVCRILFSSIYYFSFSVFIYLLIIYLFLKLFLILIKRNDNTYAFSNKNLATAVLISVFIISISFIMRSGIKSLLDTLKFF